MTDTPLCNLTSRDCEPCRGDIPALNLNAVQQRLAELHCDWRLSSGGKDICREFKFKGFARAVQMANLIAWVGDRQGHHPDITFGWAYCTVKFTTYEIGGLSINDFICAAKIDQIIDNT